MILQKDLRKGNLICLAHESNIPIVTVRELLDEHATFEEKWLFSRTYDLLMPIELNSDWMCRCGFETPDGYNVSVLYNEIMIDIHLGEYKLRDKPKAQLKYLHQLQNIFYYLVGEELTIKTIDNEQRTSR